MRATFDNFHINTTGIFRYCETPTSEPNFMSGISKYWYDHENNRVIRQSDHWGRRIRKCDWYLIDVEPTLCTALPDGKIVTAYCNLDDMLCSKKNILRRVMIRIDQFRIEDDFLARQLAA